MNETSPQQPYGRVHIQNYGDNIGRPARYVGGNMIACIAQNRRGRVVTDAVAPRPSVFESDKDWEPVTWDDMTKAERKAYKRQYPVV